MITHWSGPFTGRPNERAMVGRLMLTMLESSVAISTPIATTQNTDHLPGRISSLAPASPFDSPEPGEFPVSDGTAELTGSAVDATFGGLDSDGITQPNP